MASSNGNSNSHGGSNHPAAGAGGDDDEDNGGRQNAVNDAAASKKIGSNSSHNNGHPNKRRRKHGHGNLRRVINIPEARVIQGRDEYAYISEHEENERELLPMTTRRSYLTSKPFNVGAIADEAWRSQMEQEEEEETGNNVITRKIGIKLPQGNGRGVGKRCYCFNCW